MKRVTAIPATTAFRTAGPSVEQRKRRVAAYARVSTDLAEQLTSYEAQIRYYTEYIKSRPEWEFVKVYTDEGISGTSISRRDGFQEMMSDALAGKIDLILTKSVSRFARNTVDSLTSVRELKANGIEVYFEKENIWTFDSKGELLITIMSSLAQEESRSISENVKWGIRKRFQEGKPRFPYASLGYRKGADGNPEIVEEEAEIVRYIFSEFLLGRSISSIAKSLTDKGIPTPHGKRKWSISAVKSMLRAERYTGSFTMQKTFTEDFISKKHVVNEGQLPMYHVEDNHPSIITHEMFAAAQDEFIRRAEDGTKKESADIFASRIICGKCGSFYGRKTWHSTDQYTKRIWQCNEKYRTRDKESRKNHAPNLSEDEIKRAATEGMNRVIADRDRIMRRLAKSLSGNHEIDRLLKEKNRLAGIMNEMAEKADSILSWNSSTDEASNPEYAEVKASFETAEKELKSVESQIMRIRAQRASYRLVLNALEKHSEQLESFSEDLWISLVDRMVVYSKEDIRLILKDGTEISCCY